MSLSNATVTPANISLTPMRIKWNGVDLGGTTDSVKVNIKIDLADIHVDQFGKTVIDKRVSGHEYTVKCTLAEVNNKANWKVAFPSMKYDSATTGAIYSDMQIGDSLLAKAQVLLLHPLEKSDADLSGDYTFYKAIPIEASEVTYGPDKQSGLAVTFAIFPDTSVIPAKFMFFGDTSIGLVAASAGAGTAGSNTGNGTLTAITVTSGVTKTETITALCVGSTTGNDFYIGGSVSGALGRVHVGATSTNTVAFTSGVINFTITQGTVQFVTGDSFTVATTAANFT